MSKRGFIRRASEKLGLKKRTIDSYRSEEVLAMPPDQQAKVFLEQLPQLSAVFAAFGDPTAWPGFALYSPLEKRSVVLCYTDWKAGAFNKIEGVTTPPPAPGTTLH